MRKGGVPGSWCNQSWIFNCVKNWGELSPLQPSPVISEPSLLMNYSTTTGGCPPSSRPRMRLWLTGALGWDLVFSLSVSPSLTSHTNSDWPPRFNTRPGGKPKHAYRASLSIKKISTFLNLKERQILLIFFFMLKSFDTTWEYFVASSDLQKSSFYHEENNIIL